MVILDLTKEPRMDIFKLIQNIPYVISHKRVIPPLLDTFRPNDFVLKKGAVLFFRRISLCYTAFMIHIYMLGVIEYRTRTHSNPDISYACAMRTLYKSCDFICDITYCKKEKEKIFGCMPASSNDELAVTILRSSIRQFTLKKTQVNFSKIF